MKPPAKTTAPKAAERVSQTLERALDPLTGVLKRATQKAAAPAAPGKPNLKVAVNAVPLPVMPPVNGVEIATARAGFYKHEREDLMV
ncbi:MAG: bifunctional ornithine acetyltransferase/N-acetylglutamate synthase, partial [Alphaproteobacteria bacterium]